MAIIRQITLDSGLFVDQSYIRVQGINGNKNLAVISLEAFVSQQTCEDGKTPVAYSSYTFEPNTADDSPRWDKQAYEYIKTLPEFEGAIDA